MDEARRLFAMAIAASAVAGLAVATVFLVMLWLLGDALRAPTFGRGPLSVLPADAWLFAIVGMYFGWYSTWQAERVSGVCGSILWIPVVVSALVAVGGGYALAVILLGAIPQEVLRTLALSGPAMLISAWLCMEIEGR